ncbi:NETI motif-containing protein [Paenalkalicoccus suaedae]|uniref:NETI motif-containing protein n=1 Tax=Paenalkalicoccus suaedae TaxID=2592382 RepID=A0A859FK58_9BACI|nr:NETI motif-containing protein [Paenalkalicoccus suaedae]QKS73177.1 NETI motif-containing protein [Paenalkalicoccus suaedae]
MLAKKKFYVNENETIDQCLERMKQEGYMPVRRMEEPVLKEVKRNGKMDVEVSHQRIVFVGQELS